MEMVADLHDPVKKAHQTERRVERWNMISKPAFLSYPQKKNFSVVFIVIKGLPYIKWSVCLSESGIKLGKTAHVQQIK